MVRKLQLVWVVLLLAFGLTGCANNIIKPEQSSQSASTPLDNSEKIGQTFTAHYNGLRGVQIYLEPVGKANGVLIFHLKANPNDSSSLRTARLKFEDIPGKGFYLFSFDPIKISNRTDYYLELGLQGDGSVRVGTSEPQSYYYGALYRNGVAQEAQLTFNLGYDSGLMFFGLLQETYKWLLFLLAGTLLFIAPGWALLGSLFSRWDHYDFISKTGLSAGFSLAIYPILFLWTNLVGLKLGSLYAWLPVLIALIVILVRHVKKGWTLQNILNRKTNPIVNTCNKLKQSPWFTISLLMSIGMLIFTRLWVLRTLDLPLWGDSYQHTMIAQLLIDNNGLFNSWQPYADLTTFTYHFGFHSYVAVFHWLTGLDTPQAVIWIGQLLNILAAIALYPLTKFITKNRWAALFSMVTGGLLFSMPMYYINWGRYTQLAGQVILPGLVVLVWSSFEQSKIRYSNLLLCGIAFGGLALTHYRILILALPFIVAVWLVNLRKQPFTEQIKKVGVIGLIGGLIFLPWFLHAYSGNLMHMVGNQLKNKPVSNADFTATIANINFYLPKLAWFSLPFLAFWGLIKRDRQIMIFLIWWFLIVIVTNPQWLRLSGGGAITNFTTMLAMYIFASVLIGAGVGWLLSWVKQKSEIIERRSNWWENTTRAVFLFLLLAIIIWGGRQRLDDLEISSHALAVRPDLRAARWIQDNLPADAAFVVNSMFAYNGTSVVGTDGGWWLPLIAKRRTNQPPLPYTSEKGPIPDYKLWVNELPALIIDKGIDQPEVLSEFKERGVTHVYIGQLQGRANSDRPLLDLNTLISSSYFQLIYHQDRVWIFALQP